MTNGRNIVYRGTLRPVIRTIEGKHVAREFNQTITVPYEHRSSAIKMALKAFAQSFAEHMGISSDQVNLKWEQHGRYELEVNGDLIGIFLLRTVSDGVGPTTAIELPAVHACEE